MSQINISKLTFSYDGSSENVFDNVNLQLDTDWKLGLIGRNGRGKTTLLKLLTGELVGSGNIISHVDFEYFPYKISSNKLFLIDVIREIAPNAEDWEIYREMSLMKIDPDSDYQQFFTLSSGEQTKAMLVGLFLRQNSYLLIDEPTNHLDIEGRQQLGEYLSKKKGFILVSHDRKFLDMCTDHILSINRANISLQKGNYSDWQINKDMQDSFELAQNEKLKKDISRLSAAAERTSAWSDKVERSKYGGSVFDKGFVGHKSAKMMKRSKAIEARQQSAIEEKSKLLKNVEQSAPLKLSPLKFHSERLVRLEKVSIKYGDKPVCENVSFKICRGERIALTGKNGCGKSSILKLICGEKINYSGQLIKNGQLKISFVPQTTDHLSGTLKEYAYNLRIDLSLFLSILRKLDFPRELFEHSIENFSAGQKKKVLIAGSLCEQAHLYIWDEPLNFVDIISRSQIEQLILDSEAAMIFVEHDELFREKIADQIVIVE